FDCGGAWPGCGANTAGTNCNCGCVPGACAAADVVCMALTRSSTGMLAGGALVNGTGPVTSIPGCWGGLEDVFGGKKVPGRMRSGRGCPLGIGRTISGVTITNSSELFLVIWRERNRFPKNGILPKPGT